MYKNNILLVYFNPSYNEMTSVNKITNCILLSQYVWIMPHLIALSSRFLKLSTSPDKKTDCRLRKTQLQA